MWRVTTVRPDPTVQRLTLPEERRDTAATAESAWRSARAVRAEGSWRLAARARRWTTIRASGNAMANSIHRRIRAKRNTHILAVPSSSGPARPGRGVRRHGYVFCYLGGATRRPAP